MNKAVPVFFDIETTGLNPLAQEWWSNEEHGARVICIGVGVLTDWRGDVDNAEKHVTVLYDKSEYKLLQNAEREVYKFLGEVGVGNPFEEDNEFFMVGWNNRTFDHPYIGARYSRLRLDGTIFTNEWKRLDLMRVARNKTGKFWKQDDYMEENMGFRSEDDVTGKDVPDLLSNNRVDKIRSHCNSDLKDLMDIFLFDRKPAMEEFYDHYDIDREAVFVEEV